MTETQTPQEDCTLQGQAARSFHLGDVLSITTGSLVSPRLIDGVYDILNYMTNDSLFTHQLPRASRECKPFLLEQHPQLKMVDASGVSDWQDWMAKQVTQYGETLMVLPIPEEAHAVKNPIDEAVEMVAKNIVVCDVSPESTSALIKTLKASKGAKS